MVYGFKLKEVPLDFYRIGYILLAVPYLIYSLFHQGKSKTLIFFRLEKWKLFLALIFVSLTYSTFVYAYTGHDLTFIRMHIDYLLTSIIFVPIVYI